MAQAGIYQIINTVNNKRYIGSAVNLKTREDQHFAHLRRGVHHSSYLQRSYNKYGMDAFVFETLITCHPTMCVWYEQQFLDQLKPEYNVSPTAGSSLGIKRREDTKEKLRKINLGHITSEETKEKLRTAITGKKRRPETVERLRLAHSNRSEEYRNKISQNMKRRWSEGKYNRTPWNKGKKTGGGFQLGELNLGQHVRWHVKRNSRSPSSAFCYEG